MLRCGAKPEQSLREAAQLALGGLSALGKDVEDQNRLRGALETRLGMN
jgi:hypothetical protein